MTRLQRLQRPLRNVNLWILDGAIATLFVVASVVSLYSRDTNQPDIDYRSPNTWALLLTIAATVPFYFRRHAPLPVLVASAIPVVLLTVSDFPSGTTPTALLVAVYTVAAYCEARDRAIGSAVIALSLLVVAVLGAPDLDGTGMLLNVAFFSAAYFFGSTIRNRRMYVEQVEARAEMLERERDEDAKRAVADERLRIAQELHDVVAHSMGVIAVQAGVGAHVIDSDPAEAKRSLEAIASTSRSTLTEIRRLLGVLRENDGAAKAPAPGLADLDQLVAQLDNAGLHVAVAVDGVRDELPPGVDLTGYRIVQEALTNVLKHAGEAEAQVQISYDPGTLRLEIVDNGRGVNGRADVGGHGLLGMRERVAVYGGSLQAGPRTGGGFRVVAVLPYGGEA